MKNKHNYLKFENVDVVPPSFPDDTWKALKKTIHEAAVSYENDCYLATAILCGKIIETLLKRAYYVEFDEDPDSAGRQRGGRQRHVRLDMPEIRKKLYEREFLLEPALVVCQPSVEGYSLLSLIRASLVVNRQWTVARC